MPDPYSVLGIKRDANADEIKRAYRRLAKAHHPDRNREDPKAQDKFAALNAAYEILGDEEKRRAFDRGEIDGDGKPRASGFGASDFQSSGFKAGPGGMKFEFGGSSPFGMGGFGGKSGADPRDIFSDLFRQFDLNQQAPPRNSHAQGTSGAARPAPGQDVTLEVEVPLETIAAGGTTRVNLPDERVLEVKIPQGMANGATMRLKGQGKGGAGARGDALLTIRYARHKRFTPDGADLRVSVPVPLRIGVLGGSARVPTLDGEVEITIPAWTSGGKTLRLRGKGLPLKERTGDLLVTLDLDLGEKDDALETFFRARSS
jgi:DnaJ-class molecular chaperone